MSEVRWVGVEVEVGRVVERVVERVWLERKWDWDWDCDRVGFLGLCYWYGVVLLAYTINEIED